MAMALSWMLKNCVCSSCKYPIVVTQAKEEYCDYWYYCSNPDCSNHTPGEQLADTEDCSFMGTDLIFFHS